MATKPARNSTTGRKPTASDHVLMSEDLERHHPLVGGWGAALERPRPSTREREGLLREQLDAQVRLGTHVAQPAPPGRAIGIHDQTARERREPQPARVASGYAEATKAQWRQVEIERRLAIARPGHRVDLRPREAGGLSIALHLEAVDPVVAEP